MKRVHLLIDGVVQGVGYRYATARTAQHHGVTGWVRNEPGGDVAALVEGASADVDAFVRWCGEGPRHARVDSVEVSPAADTGATSFEVRS